MFSLGCLALMPAISLGAIHLAAWRASALSGYWPRVGRSVREQFLDDRLSYALQELAGISLGFAFYLIPMVLLILIAAFVRSRLTLLAWLTCSSCYVLLAFNIATESSATLAWWMV